MAVGTEAHDSIVIIVDGNLVTDLSTNIDLVVDRSNIDRLLSIRFLYNDAAHGCAKQYIFYRT